MKRKWSFAIDPHFLRYFCRWGVGTLSASKADDLASTISAAAQTAKQQCISNCRARYRDCRRLNQLPSSECRGIYQDCTRYSCTGLGPG